MDKKSLPKPLGAGSGRGETHAFQIGPKSARHAASRRRRQQRLEFDPAALGPLLELLERLGEHHFLARQIGAEGELGKQSARPRQRELLLKRLWCVVAMTVWDPVVGCYLAVTFGLGEQAFL